MIEILGQFVWLLIMAAFVAAGVVLHRTAKVMWHNRQSLTRDRAKVLAYQADALEQQRISSLECELGLCEHAVFLSGERWMICSKQIAVGDPRNVDRYRRPRPSVTNDFGPRNKALWDETHPPPPPPPAAPPERFQR